MWGVLILITAALGASIFANQFVSKSPKLTSEMDGEETETQIEKRAAKKKPSSVCLKNKSKGLGIVLDSSSFNNHKILIKTTIQTKINYVPNIRSGSFADIGRKRSMEDAHLRIDDLSTHLGPLFNCPLPSAFYAVFDGHGGSDAAIYLQTNSMKFIFQELQFPQSFYTNAYGLEKSIRKAFSLADLALADKSIADETCGTTALTALVLGTRLVVANVGDCRAVLCRNGTALDMSQDHRPNYPPERTRVQGLGATIYDGYFEGEIALTRTLGDWYLKPSALIAEPDVQQLNLTKDDEFLIIACDGIWDVMSSQFAVSLVRRGLRRHDDPQQCAQELVMEASHLNSSDNLTALVISFASPSTCQRQRPRFTCTKETRNKLQRLLQGN